MIAKRKRVSRCKTNPTPREIRRQCEEIQDGWSPRERQSRRRAVPKRWVLPFYVVSEIADFDPELN